MAKTFLKKIKKFIVGHKLEIFVLFIILLVASFLRLYKIADYMTFLGDEGRDVIIVRRLLVEFHPPLIGPGTSIGNMYLGPLYYYIMAPALLLANFSPIGPAVEIAILGVVTVYLVYYLSRKWFGAFGGLLAAFLYSISPVIIIYSRSSWNPNIMPFFALLCILSIWKVWQEQRFVWLSVLGISFACVLQSHYLGLLLGPTFAIFWFLTFLKVRKTKKAKNFFLNTLYSAIIFLLLMSPLVIFDARHGWHNLAAMKEFFTKRQTTVSIKPWASLAKIYPQFEKIVTRVVAGTNLDLGKWVSVGLLAVVAWVAGTFRVKLEKKEKLAYLLIITWIGFGLIGLSLYKQEIYDHYYGFLMPAPFLLIAGLFQHLVRQAKIRGILLIIPAVACIAFFNFQNSPLNYPPNKQLDRSLQVSKIIIDEAHNQPLNFAVIAERNYEGAYRYMLDIGGAKVVDIDPLNPKSSITELLFVVCEKEASKCDPTHGLKPEVANFGWTKVDQEWHTYGVIIYKLVHSIPPTITK